MDANSMGRRFERLLFLAAPLAVASLLVVFVALASDQQEERKRARCLRSAADAINLYEGDLNEARRGKRVVIEGMEATAYWLALRFALIPWEVRNPGCLEHFPRLGIADKILEPKALIEKARKEATELDGRPLALYGIELPDKATLSLFGTVIKMDLTTLVRVMQIALGPILILWLSSIYQTRHRESLLIGRMRDVSTLYPHLVNVYPVVPRGDPAWESPRKKSWTKFFYLKFGVPAFFALIRISLLSVFLGPPVAFYAFSVYLLRGDAFSTAFLAMAFLVNVFAVATAFCEFLPWHLKKRFTLNMSSTT